jgi:anthranilate phosphoribosyltransferase
VYVLRELGIMPSATLAQAQDRLDNEGIAFVPTALLAPGLAELLSLRARLGVRSPAHSMAKLIDPFAGESLRVVSASHPPHLAGLRSALLASSAHALLLQSTEGEPFANPERRPRLEYFWAGSSQLLFDAEIDTLKSSSTLPTGIDAVATAAWIRQALAGETSVPLPLVNQLACCLFAAGYTCDLNQAKAIVAVQTGSLAAA